MFSTTSYSGESPKWLWSEFKEVPPNEQNGNDRQICAIAIYVAIYRYEFLSAEDRDRLHDLVDEQVPSPDSNPGGSIAETVLNDLHNRRDSA